MQESFQYGYETIYGKCKKQILPEKDIDKSMTTLGSECFELIGDNGDLLGGAIIVIDNITHHNHLDFLYIKVGVQGRGLGLFIWKEIEKLYPTTVVWETCTPYFDKRNIHFYVNKLGFYIVEYYNSKHKDPNMLDDYSDDNADDGMFKFEKYMNK